MTRASNYRAGPRESLIEEGGRDPLGLSRVSSVIIDFLMQGIITQTRGGRHYSFYCWVIWHIEKEEGIDNVRAVPCSFSAARHPVCVGEY